MPAIPVLSVIVSSRGRAAVLRACLESLQPVAGDEVLVVREHWDPNTRAVVDQVRRWLPIRTVRCPAGRADGRNRATEIATSSHCLYVDDDSLFGPGLVDAHRQIHQIPTPVFGVTVPPSAAVSESLSPVDCDRAPLSVSRTTMIRLGGFATDLPALEDIDLAARLMDAGLEPVRLQLPGMLSGLPAPEARQERAAAWLQLYQRHPKLLPELPLGEFHTFGLRGMLLLKLLLALPRRDAVLSVARELTRAYGSPQMRHLVERYNLWQATQGAPGGRDAYERLTHPPVILMYHAIGGPGETSSRYILPVASFARQMAWLARQSYRVLSLEELVRYRREFRLPPSRSVVLTFDDGYQDTWTMGSGVLRRYGFPATVFTVTGAIGGVNNWDRQGELVGRPLLTWAQIEQLRKFGIDVGGHGHSHVSLPGLSAEQLTQNITSSYAALERALGSGPRYFAYPHGRYDAAVIAAVQQAGFGAACSSEPGPCEPVRPAYVLPRAEIRGDMSMLEFALTLWLGKTRAVWRLAHGQ